MLFSTKLKAANDSILKSENKLRAAGKTAPPRPDTADLGFKAWRPLEAHAAMLEKMTKGMAAAPFRVFRDPTTPPADPDDLEEDAPGATPAGKAPKGSMLRSEFQKLLPADASKFCLDGGKVLDSLAETVPVAGAIAATVTAADLEKPAAVITRAEFQKLSPAAASKFCLGGGKIKG